MASAGFPLESANSLMRSWCKQSIMEALCWRCSKVPPLRLVVLDYCKTNILLDTMGFNAIGVSAAIELFGVDRVVFGTDFGPVPYGIKEHVQIVEDVLPNPAERQLVFCKTSNRVFRLGLSDTDLVTENLRLPSQDCCSPITAVALERFSHT